MPRDRATVIIGPRFNGPPGSANGGFACGVAAHALGDGPTEVRLRRPPPLAAPLDLRYVDDGVELSQEGSIVATARPWSGAVDVPAVPEPDELAHAVDDFDGVGYERCHPFETCFTCGPARAAGD